MENINLKRNLPCSASQAWNMWTDSYLLSTFFGEGSKVEIVVGGPYEIYFSMKAPLGERGSEKCVILDFEKDKSLSFTWNAPPSIPKARNSGLFTKVSVLFIDEDESNCKIQLIHSGWDFEGEHWKETNAYFSQAWPYVLNQLEEVINQRK